MPRFAVCFDSATGGDEFDLPRSFVIPQIPQGFTARSPTIVPVSGWRLVQEY